MTFFILCQLFFFLKSWMFVLRLLSLTNFLVWLGMTWKWTLTWLSWYDMTFWLWLKQVWLETGVMKIIEKQKLDTRNYRAKQKPKHLNTSFHIKKWHWQSYLTTNQIIILQIFKLMGFMTFLAGKWKKKVSFNKNRSFLIILVPRGISNCNSRR